jgi:nucleoside-diphosphate-sugar epimerase
MKTVLVLGSEGTLGKSLCNIFEKKNINVVHWDIKMGKKYDLRNKDNLNEIIESVDYVIFLAFDVGGSKYDVNNKEFIDNNMKIILHTFDTLYKSNTPFIYATSCMSNMITNPYGSLKNISEHYVKLMNGINVKLWNVYGDEDISEKSHVIPDFIDSALKKNIIKMKTQGNELRQFIHCDDFSEALFEIMNNHGSFITSSKTIDLSSYEWLSIYDLANEIKDIFENDYNKKIEIVKGCDLDNHTQKNEPSLSKLNEIWQPKISLKNGLKKIISQKMT